MSFNVIRDAAGQVMSFGDAAHFDSPIPTGCTLTVEAVCPTITPHYTQLRAAAYPPVTDYLDGLVKGDTAQMQAYVDACLAVKAKYPKV